MITINPSSDSDDAATAPEVAASIEEHKKRIPLVWIAATISIGLLIAAIYLGTRIVTAHKTAVRVAVSVAAPVAITKPTDPPPLPPAAPTVVTPTAESEHDSDNAIPLITPHTGERYLQVGALDAEATRRFVERLRREKLEPHVAPGPKPELMRVLIGPFDNREALMEKKAQIESEGMDTFVREY